MTYCPKLPESEPFCILPTLCQQQSLISESLMFQPAYIHPESHRPKKKRNGNMFINDQTYSVSVEWTYCFAWYSMQSFAVLHWTEKVNCLFSNLLTQWIRILFDVCNSRPRNMLCDKNKKRREIGTQKLLMQLPLTDDWYTPTSPVYFAFLFERKREKER